MTDMSPMTEIEQSVYSQLEFSKEIFRIVQRLTDAAREVDTAHHTVLQELAEELLHTGKEISDHAETLGKNLVTLILKG